MSELLKRKDADSLDDELFYAALSIAIYFPLFVIISAIWMLLGHPVNIALVCGVAIADFMVIYLFLPGEKRIRKIFFIVLFDILLMWLSGEVAGSVYDTSFDGQWYHQEAVIQLRNGWNPYEKRFSLPDSDATFFAVRYPQADAISLYAIWLLFPNNIEAAKGLNFILAAVAYVLLRRAFLLLFSSADKRKRRLIDAVALLAVLNPVCIYQFFTFYVDARMYDCLLICISLLIIYHFKPNRFYQFVFAINIIYLINEKFTGLMYAALIAAAYSVYLLFIKKGMRIIRLIPYAFTIILISFMVVGYSSYLKNYIYSYNPLYPIMGSGNITAAMVSAMQPANFQGKSNFYKCTHSYTALPLYSRYPDSSKQRNIFDPMGVKYYSNYNTADTDMSGFGIYFFELFLLLLPVIFLLLKNHTSRPLILMIYSLLFVSVLLNPMSFIARYAPHLWLLVVIPLCGLIQLEKTWIRRCHWALITLCFLNCSGIIFGQIGMLKRHWYLQDQMNELKQEQPVILYSKWSSIPERLKENGIQFTVVTQKDSSQNWNEILCSYQSAYWKKQ